VANIFVIISVILNVISKFVKSYETLIVSRFISGLFCGFFSGILPHYLYELAPANYKRLVGSMQHVWLALGFLTSNIYGLSELLGTENKWPILVGLMIVPVIAHVFFLAAVESPKHLYVNQNKVNEAERALAELRGKASTELILNELDQLESEKVKQNTPREISWTDIFTQPLLRHPLMIVVGLQIAVGFSGVYAVSFTKKLLLISYNFVLNLAAIVLD
jgi:MFS family permease